MRRTGVLLVLMVVLACAPVSACTIFAVTPGASENGTMYLGHTNDGVGQDWVDWEQRGLLDFVFPMNYTMVPKVARHRTMNHLAALSGKTPLWEGLWYRPTLSPDEFLAQVDGVRELGIEGIVVFEYYRLTDDVLDMLAEL